MSEALQQRLKERKLARLLKKNNQTVDQIKQKNVNILDSKEDDQEYDYINVDQENVSKDLFSLDQNNNLKFGDQNK